jgi:hypothetical protein
VARGLYDVACEALPDIPGAEDDAVEPFADWLAHEFGYRPGIGRIYLVGPVATP